MLKNIDIIKFKAECQSIRATMQTMHPDSSHAQTIAKLGLRTFYDWTLDRDAIRLAVQTTAAPTPAAARKLADFASEVRAAALNTNDQIRASTRQVNLIIKLADDLQDFVGIGQHTLTRRDAAQIINGMLRDVERLTDKI